MFPSKYNILEKLNSPVENYNFILLNSFTGSIDYIDEATAKKILSNNIDDINVSDYLICRGYYYNEIDEEFNKVQALSNFVIDKNPKKKPKIILLTTYSCNYNCHYCYQNNIDRNNRYISEDQIHTIYEYIRNKEISEIDLIGGEPLLNNDKSYNSIKEILKLSYQNKISVRIITNGSYLDHYIGIFKKYPSIKFVQITIDGPIDDKKNARDNKQIYRNAKLALDSGIKVACRINIDINTLQKLNLIFNEFEKYKLMEHTSFRPYVSPIHNHDCDEIENFVSEFEILKEYLNQKKCNNFDMLSDKNFIITEYLSNTKIDGQAKSPRFYRCEANANQLVFDPFGFIYPCIEAAGTNKHNIGSFDSEVKFNIENLKMWREKRIVTNQNECINCPACFICGGDCSWSYFNTEKSVKKIMCQDIIKSISFYLQEEGHKLHNTSCIPGRI